MKALHSTVLAAGFFIANCALATPIKWTLQNTSFSDGAAVQGYFEWDADKEIGRQLVDFSVTVSQGTSPSFPEFSYSFQNRIIDADLSSGTTGQITIGQKSFESTTFLRLTNNNGQGRELRLLLPTLLTNSGGQAQLSITDTVDGISMFSGECYNCGPYRFLESGAVTASVPEPSQFVLVLIGLSVFAMRGSRKGRPS